MHEITLPEGAAPYGLARDADDTVWVSLLGPGALARVDKDGGVEVHPLQPAGTQPMLLRVAADGTVWHSRRDDRLGRLDPHTGAHSTVELGAGAAPYGLDLAPDGTLWFTAAGSNRLGRVDPDGGVHTIDLPVPDARAAMLTVDADGTVWAALNGAAALARVDRSGEVDLVRLPEGAAPVGIAAGGDGVWFADIARGLVGRVHGDGTVAEFALDDPTCRPHAVATDRTGGCWVTLWGSGRLARVSADGTVVEQALPGDEPHGLVVTDTHVWVAMESGTLAVVERT